MEQVWLAFISQNIRRFFWLIILVAIIVGLFIAGDKAEALKWMGILGGVALTQIKSNTADPKLTPETATGGNPDTQEVKPDETT